MATSAVSVELSVLAPIIKPIIQQAWDGPVYAALVAEVAKISSPDLQMLAQALLPAIKAFVDQEIAKIGA